ncbi:MAG: ankyrin repeat domain-containing protein [Erythrobacter sp.]
MALDVFRKIEALGAISSALVLVLAVPAAAQFQSEGYKFLEAVKDRDGDVATDMLNKPGTQVINTRDITSGDTGLHLVVQRRDVLWIRFLLQRGADPNIRNKKGITPLQLATAMGFIDGVEALIRGGANVNVGDQTGETPLIAAVHQRNPELVRVLLAHGADPDHNDNSGRSARQYVELMNGNSLMKQIFQEADDKRAGKEPKRQYGPSF